MNIGKFWKLEADSLNVKLFHRLTRTSKQGEKYQVWDVQGYYATPKEALKAMVNQGIRDTELKDLKTIVEGIDKLHELIDGLPLQPLPKRTRQAREPLKRETNGKAAGN